MTREFRVQTSYALLLGALLTASMLLVREVDKVRADEPIQEVLYIPSPKVVKRLSLGYSGLLADIYWTRVVQYFGTKHRAKARQYLILEPLLDMTTTLDPQLLPAYEFGSVFLAQKPPEGAGNPEAAARLVEKGIRENPQAWRLYYDLGYIYWLEMKDPAKASDAFERGSKIAGAHPWMKVMAAALAAHAGETETAVYMWTNILNSSEDNDLRANAMNRLRCLRVDGEVKILQERVDQFTKQAGRLPSGWGDLISAGLLRGVPMDPKNSRYQLVNGRVQVAHPDLFPFITKGLPPEREPGDLPDDPGYRLSKDTE
jgi:tetratricopeptide (TPR) repeat protein